MWICLAVDPGKKGGVAFIREDGSAYTYPTPATTVRTKRARKKTKSGKPSVKSKTDYNFKDMYNLLLGLCKGHRKQEIYVVLEEAHARPTDGRSSAFQTGVGFGLWRMATAVLDAGHFILTSPGDWRAFMVGDFQPKSHSLTVARSLWPKVKLPLAKQDGEAEALLMAHYACMNNFELLPGKRPRLAKDLPKPAPKKPFKLKK